MTRQTRSFIRRFIALQFLTVLTLAGNPTSSAHPMMRLSEPARRISASSIYESKTLTSFESAKAGTFQELDTPIGTWTPKIGKTIVDDKHAKTGKHCLQLTGGEKTSVVLRLAEDADTTGELRFWAERWTVRKPFSFRIEKETAEGWKEIYNGDQKVRVGRAFLTHVAVPLGDPNIKRLRFSVTSPSNTGILIDDIELAPARPQRITSVQAVPLTLPALVGTEASPILKLKIETEGTLNPITLTEVQASLQHEKGDLVSAQVYVTVANSQFKTGLPFGQAKSMLQPDAPLMIRGKHALNEGANYVWITGRLSQGADVTHRVGATCTQVSFSNGHSVKLNASSTQRMGVAVRNGGDDKVHTYRIPGLATTNKGTLIAVYDVRRRGGGDLPGDIDVGMSRSTDGGRTWEAMKVIMDMGDDPAWRYDGIGDPAVLVDRKTGTIWVAATWSHGNRSWIGSGPGLTPEETGQFMLTRSDDDGVTWSKPINITKQVKKPEWSFILQGPGKGITMRDGTIVFAAQYQDPPNATNRLAHRLPHSTIIYSKDHGKTWDVGTGAFDDTTEAQVVEIEPGVLMLNCRYNRKSVRVVMTTRDLGKSWQKHPTSELSLIEPRACMASLINVDQEVGKPVGNWLLFSNPNSTSGRDHITIKASPDRGLTWPKEFRLLLDEQRSAGYSCMSMIDDKTVGILYEGSQAHMTFQRIPLREIVAPPRIETDQQSLNSESLRLPRIFGDHMVLQADAGIPVWGDSSPNSIVTVTLGSEKQATHADESGKWVVRLMKRKASETPLTMTIESETERIQWDDILIGEVWVCAGQSNMEWPLRQSTHGSKELSQANHPTIRLMHLSPGATGSSGSYTSDQLSRLVPDAFCQGNWQVASADSARNFSAVAWYFGRKLQGELGVPVGLICPAVGGTPTEAWIPRSALEADPELKGLVVDNWLDNERMGEFCRARGQQNLLALIQSGETIPSDELGPNHPFKPGFMWEAGIAPLIPFAIRGVIWYQGESNAETSTRVHDHHKLFRLLIQEWRTSWEQGDFPFLFVQLPAINRPEWPWFRHGQRRALQQLNNVGMAITIDTGHPSNVHPPLKKPVGERLAKWALGTTYQAKSHAVYSGPLFQSAKRTGDVMLLTFNLTGSGLKSSDGKPLRHFEICGADDVFHPAQVNITGTSTLSVTSPKVKEPLHVRYAWVPFPDPAVNLFNSENLPASPFTTEPWLQTREGKKK